MSDQNQGSFLGGLALGMFAGAAGFFLFATKDGAKTRQKLEKEWEGAKSKMADDGIIKDKNMTLSQMIGDWLGMASTPTTKKTSKKKTSKASSTKGTTSKFKGV